MCEIVINFFRQLFHRTVGRHFLSFVIKSQNLRISLVQHETAAGGNLIGATGGLISLGSAIYFARQNPEINSCGADCPGIVTALDRYASKQRPQKRGLALLPLVAPDNELAIGFLFHQLMQEALLGGSVGGHDQDIGIVKAGFSRRYFVNMMNVGVVSVRKKHRAAESHIVSFKILYPE